MLFFFSLILSIFLSSGFYLFGQIITKLLRFQNIIKNVSNPIFQYVPIGIFFFLFLLYPLFFIIQFNKFLFQYISYLFVFLGIINFFKNFILLKNFF